MNIRMNYIKDGVTKEVTVLGFAKDSGWATRDYCECFDDNTGHFIAPIKSLQLTEKSTQDLMIWYKEQEEIGKLINDIINNA